MMKTAQPPRPSQPIQMIALDLDGSLLRSDKTVGERTIKALQAAAAKGVEIVLASGRMTAAMEKPATIIGIDVSMVAFNGAAVCGRAATKRERYFHQPLDAGIASELLDIAHQRGYQCNFYQNDVILSEDGPNLRPYIEIYRGRTGSPFRFVKNLRDFAASAPTKLLYVVDAGKRNAISEELRPRFGSRTAMMHTDPEYLEFLDPQVNKGTGLNKLGEVLGIPMTQAMAIGDGENDIPMLEVAGIGVAVANAGKLCKAAANAFTDADNDHDAVAEALEKWVL